MSTERPETTSNDARQAASKKVLFDSLVLVLLSIATVGTAWCSFQAAVWSGVSQRTMNLSAAASRRGVVNQLQAYQVALLDVLLFSQHINARANSNEMLAQFYSDRFRGEAKVAFQAWLNTRPFENASAPPHPFVTNLYRPHLLVDAHKADDEAQRLWQQGGEAGKTSRSYVLVTVMLACALFCGGTASKLDTGWMRRGVLLLGLTALLFAAARLWLLPVRL